MDILYLLIPLSLVLVFAIGAVFWLALRGGQFDDLESPGLEVVLDDDKPGLHSASGAVSIDASEGGAEPRAQR